MNNMLIGVNDIEVKEHNCKTPTAIITVKKYFKIPRNKNLCVWSQYVAVHKTSSSHIYLHSVLLINNKLWSLCDLDLLDWTNVYIL